MKKSIIVLINVLVGFILMADAQIDAKFQGTYEQKFDPQLTENDWQVSSAKRFVSPDGDFVLAFPKDFTFSVPEDMDASLKKLDSVMKTFFDGFQNVDTVIEDGDSKMSMRSSFKTFSSLNGQEIDSDTLFGFQPANMHQLQQLKDSFMESFERFFPMIDGINIQEGYYTVTTDQDGNTQTSSSYSITDKDGNVYTDDDINIIITSNSIEEVIASTGETFSLISFENDEIEETQTEYRITPKVGFPFTVTKSENGASQYTKFRLFPFSLTKIQTDKKSVTEDNNIGLSIYPNPTSDVLTVSAKDNINSAELINMAGQKIFETQISGNYTQIYTGNFAKGSYVLNIYTDKDKISKRVVIK